MNPSVSSNVNPDFFKSDLKIQNLGFEIDSASKTALKTFLDASTGLLFTLKVKIDHLEPQEIDERLSHYNDEWCQKQATIHMQLLQTDPLNKDRAISTENYSFSLLSKIADLKDKKAEKLQAIAQTITDLKLLQEIVPGLELDSHFIQEEISA